MDEQKTDSIRCIPKVKLPRVRNLLKHLEGSLDSRPTAAPSSDAPGPSIKRIRFARNIGTTLSRLCRDALGAKIASFSFPRCAASRTCCTPTTTRRPFIPTPSRRMTLRAVSSSMFRRAAIQLTCREPRRRSRLPRRHQNPAVVRDLLRQGNYTIPQHGRQAPQAPPNIPQQND